MAEGVHIVCPHCGQKNNIPLGKSASEANCGRCKHHLFEGRPVEVDDANFVKQIEGNTIPVVVDFWAEWCGPCRAMAPAFAQVAANLEPAARFVKVNVDQSQGAAGRLGVQGIPALFVLRGGRVIGRQVGALNAAALQNWVERTIGA